MTSFEDGNQGSSVNGEEEDAASDFVGGNEQDEPVAGIGSHEGRRLQSKPLLMLLR